MTFQDKVAVVTGAGGGLGRAIALGLAKGGAKVAIVDVKADLLDETAALVRDIGGEAETITIDITQPANCAAIIARAVERFGRLDILINNAGVIFFSALDKVTEADWNRTFAVNVHAPFYLMQAAMPHLLESQGAIVNICSNAAFKGQAFCPAYGATKAALVNLTMSLAMEFIHKPVRINAVAPGAIKTNMAFGSAMPEGIDYTLIGRIAPLRAMSEPEDIAAVALFLASDAAKAVHGATYTVDQGMMAG